MAKKSQKSLTIALSNEQLLAQDRHTDWKLAQERGAHRNGRRYVAPVVQGVDKTKKARSKKACRGKVRY